jgi:phosphoenolpyruvate carboxykinase (ATP)
MKTDWASRYDDLTIAELVEHALTLGEGQLSAKGALIVSTERHSEVQRFIVNEPSVSDVIRADAQFKLLDNGVFKLIWERVKDDIVERDRYRIHAQMGVNAEIAVPLEMTTVTAWHAMSCHHLCHVPEEFNPREKPEWKLIWAPISSFGDAETLTHEGGIVLIHVGKRRILMGGDLTTGEMRRTLLTLLGLILPEKDTLPLHGAASQGDGEISLFLGPAGTQKTTWALRCGQLIGDRGLSWSNAGLHRLADGCRLHLDHNLPISLDEALRFGTIAENLALGNDREPLLTDPEADSAVRIPTHLVLPLTRLNANQASDTPGPSQLVILATDPLGVLPPLSKITREQCLAWFILGYGNHLGPLEKRQAEIDIRFTPGFMDTLLPRNLDDYVFILDNLLAAHDTRCFLVNAGWHGGQAGQGDPLSTSEESAVITGMYYCTDW